MFITLKKATINNENVDPKQGFELASEALNRQEIYCLKLNPELCILPLEYYDLDKEHEIKDGFELAHFLIRQYRYYHGQTVKWTFNNIELEFKCS